MNCTVEKMTPERLWKSRLEYQDFPLSVFRKHIYQETMKQLAAPFWQHKCNKNTTKKLDETETMMKDWHQNQLRKERLKCLMSGEGLMWRREAGETLVCVQ